jgi:hypothetical protein
MLMDVHYYRNLQIAMSAVFPDLVKPKTIILFFLAHLAIVHNVFSLAEILKIFLSETTKSIEL